ncbi:hypothetical protein BC629DRAFT_1487636 [Irpex lacteus]|nr:hypothetical protein BC629DRAFT_1487636 [Irpex lacteus]
MAVASAAMYFYDWIVTLDVEVDYIWVCKWTLSTWIFLVNRYATLVDAMLLLYLNPNRQM